MDFFSMIREWVMFAANICVLFITMYTFYITFISKKLRFLSISESFSMTEGSNFSVVIENRSFSPIVIKNVFLIVDNKYKIMINSFDDPLILSQFSAQKIESERYSFMNPKVQMLGKIDLILEVLTSRKTIYIKINNKIPKVNDELKGIFPNVVKIKNTYHDKIVPQNAKYALSVSHNEKTKTVFIFESGSMTESILGFNTIPVEIVKNQETLNKFFNERLSSNGINYILERVNENTILINKEI